MESGLAIQGCMDAIGFVDRSQQSYEVNAQFRFPSSPQRLGNVRVTFIRRNSSDFPEIDCGPEIRSFGSFHENYRATSQTIALENNEATGEAELRISQKDEYDFILIFKAKKVTNP